MEYRHRFFADFKTGCKTKKGSKFRTFFFYSDKVKSDLLQRNTIVTVYEIFK
jgi:hypothetical protein